MSAGPTKPGRARVRRDASSRHRSPAAVAVARRAARSDRAYEAATALAAAATSLIVVVWILRLYDGWAPSDPLGYESDAFYYASVVQSVLENGWYLDNPRLGAPFGSESFDFPVVSNDALQLFLIKVLGLFFASPYTVMNAFYLLTFPLTALSAFWVMRRLSVSRPAAFLGAVLFATTPYHFLKGEFQLFFSSYYLVPLSCLLVLRVMGGDRLFTRRPDVTGVRGWLTARSLGLVALCALIAIAGVYYAVFTIVLVAAGGVLRAIAERRVLAAAPAAVIAGVIAAAIVVAQTPTILYRTEHGPNPGVAARSGADTEFFALKFDQMVFPVYGHRIDSLARFTDDYRAETRMLGEPASYLGALGTIGLLWLLVVGIAAVASTRGPPIGSRLERHAAAATLVAFLFATAGGVSAVIGYALTAQIRTWSRMSIVIAFFSILAVALLLTRLAAGKRPAGRRWLALGVVAVILVVAVVEQTSPRFAPDHDAIAARVDSDQGYFHAIEQRLPPKSMVLQLPHAPFPENPAYFGGGDYLPMTGVLNTSQLRWSYGAMKGRRADWLASLEEVPLDRLVDGASAAGFGGVSVDRRAFADRGGALEGSLTELIGPPVIGSADGNLVFFDLRAHRNALPPGRVPAMAGATVKPVSVVYAEGFAAREGSGEDRYRWSDVHGEIVLDNPDEQPRRMLLDVLLRTDAPQPGSTTVTLPGGAATTVRIDAKGSRLRRVFDAPPGESQIQFDTRGAQVALPAPETRRLFVQLSRPIIVGEALCPAGANERRRLARCVAGARPQLP